MPHKEQYPIILNTSNLVSSSNNNVYRYEFPQGSVKFIDNDRVAIGNINMFYSWFNITAALNNNTFSIDFPVFGTLNITVPDGFYDITSLNSYIQQEFITNDLYLIDTNGDFVYYLELVENPTVYAVQQNSYPVPTALPAGFTAPAGWPGFPGIAETPLLIVAANDFRNIIGFNAGTTPAVAQATTFSKTSDFTPQVSPVSSIVVLCSLINSRLSNPPQILYSFAPDVAFGSLIQSKPNEYAYINIQPGSYNCIDIEFRDQNFNPLPLIDTNLIIQLLIKTINISSF
jgi:hypothetical protein